ncbi:hypothetical protein VP01_308g9 [Puccinia sorghi]|uniref:Uncharacterized protein n=1 Tax=Puccinia sorghi TaxID=27349 RepID=A0A0L6UZL9_9BASI|nr:hypothetical protein VP01_308g9 [Puccinia sorghi]
MSAWLKHAACQLQAFSQFITHFPVLRDVEKHKSIENDLIKHLWDFKGK